MGNSLSIQPKKFPSKSNDGIGWRELDVHMNMLISENQVVKIRECVSACKL